MEVLILVWLLVGAFISGFFLSRTRISSPIALIIGIVISLIVSMGASIIFNIIDNHLCHIFLVIVITLFGIGVAKVFGCLQAWAAILLSVFMGWSIGEIIFCGSLTLPIYIFTNTLIGLSVGSFVRFRNALP